MSAKFHRSCHLIFQGGGIQVTMMLSQGLRCWINSSLVVDKNMCRENGCCVDLGSLTVP